MACDLASLPRVVVIGAGFAGLAAARRLIGGPIALTLVDVHNFHTFQPLLYQVATAGLDPADVAFPIRAIFGQASNLSFRRGRVVRIDTERREVHLGDGSALAYDALIVASGAAASFLAIEGAAAHTLPLYTLSDARRLRNALLGVLDSADAHPERFAEHLLTLVVVGGGATGVETAGAVIELLDISVRHDHLRIDLTRTRVVIVDVADRLLGAFSARSSRYAYEEVARRGVEVRLSSGVAAVDEHSVHFSDGSSIDADLVIWAGGVTVDGTIAATLPAERARGGRIVVEHDLSLAEHGEIFVVGDAAAVPRAPAGRELAPQLAQVAMQSGRHAATQALARLAGSPTSAFTYTDKGAMATIGRRAAVAELNGPGPLRGRVVRGTLGWLAWLGLHLVYLVGARNRAVVLLNWLWRYLGWSSGPRIIVGDDPPD